MNSDLMRVMRVTCFVSLALVLGLNCASYADLPRVIGNWEDSNDGWQIFFEAGEGTKAQSVKGNATLGGCSYKVYVPSEWQKSLILDMSEDANLLKDFGNTTKIKMDVTLKAKEWVIGSGWIKPVEAIVIQDDMGGWQQLSPDGNEADNVWNGSADKTFTVAFVIPPQTPPPLTQAKLLIVTSYGGVTTAGNFYFDNIRLLGSNEPKKPKEPVKAGEPNKAAEPNKK